MSDKKVVLVTGASRGLGQAIALVLGKAGYVIAGTATSQAGADKISATLREASIEGQGFVLDVCDPDQVKATHEAIVTQLGDPAILVNNAGITRDNLMLRMKEEEWLQVLETNLTSVYRLSKLCLKKMLKNRWGRIVNVTSIVALSGNPGQANYCAAKAGMIGFTKSLAQEIGAYGVTVNAVAPGFMDTDMTRALPEAQREKLLAQIPMRKLGIADDIAFAVKYLISDEANYVTGVTINVNGGMYMQ